MTLAPPAEPRPIAEDEVGRIAGDLCVYALDFATHVTIASNRRRPRGERAEALRKAFEIWPKICRRVPRLEAAAPASAAAGREADAAMQDKLEAFAERQAARGDA